MRIWLNPTKMAAHGLVPADVSAAINEQSLEAAAGQLGENSGESFQYIIKYSGKYKTEEQYGDIVIKSLDNGQVLRLQDVAEIELGSQTYGGYSELNGNPAVAMAIYQTPRSNAQDIINDIKKELNIIEKNLPEGVKYKINLDSNEFLDASIDKVVTTLIEAFILV